MLCYKIMLYYNHVLLTLCVSRGQDVAHANSSDSGVSQEPLKTVAYVELLKRRSEPLGLVLKGKHWASGAMLVHTTS